MCQTKDNETVLNLEKQFRGTHKADNTHDDLTDGLKILASKWNVQHVKESGIKRGNLSVSVTRYNTITELKVP